MFRKIRNKKFKKIENQMRVKQLEKNDMCCRRRTREKRRDNKIEN